MLVTDVGGLAEIVPDGKVGFVVKPEPEAIGTAIARFFREDREEEFAKNVQKEKVRFSWDHFTSRFLSFVNKINAD
jgi:glycosyltransferase involved in cell wall biosynthesis